MVVINIRDIQHFHETVAQGVTVIHFWDAMCKPCEHLDTVLEELSQLHKDSKFARVEAVEQAEVCGECSVSKVPSFVVVKNGSCIDRVDGADAAALTDMTNKHCQTQQSTQADVNTRIKQLLGSTPVLLFMKGSPGEPKCGFSSRVVGYLNKAGVQYKHFDILEDQEIRQGLKEYSEWPTFPQLYVNAELIGGCDIISEMAATGELAAACNISQQSVPQRIKQLLSSNDVLLFMKGNRGEPRCGFSSKVIDVLNQWGGQYNTFDILEDQDIRQGLKEYSEWPTYPQLYVKGELVGGCDIILQMAQDGSLNQELNQQLQAS